MMFSQPKISVVTPSYNQGKFIEDTILSVLGQNYINLEYIIIDGGSTDNTIDIIKKYSDKITYWISEQDSGQSHAINKGFALATGDILCWLNSDDLYMPNVLNIIANKFQSIDNKKSILFGNTLHFNESNNILSAYGSDVIGDSKRNSLENRDYIIQPSTFWTKQVWNDVGCLRNDIHYAFDWEWFLRAEKKGIQMVGLPNCFSMYRLHDSHKTGTGGDKRRLEILGMLQEYSPRYAYLYSELMKKDLTLNKLSAKFLSRLLNLFGYSNHSVDQLMILNKSKYKGYTRQEIIGVFYML